MDEESAESKAWKQEVAVLKHADAEKQQLYPSASSQHGYLSIPSSLQQHRDDKDTLFGVMCVLLSTIGFSLASVLIKRDVQPSGANFPTIEIAILRAVFGFVLGMAGIRLLGLPIIPKVPGHVLQLALIRGALDFSASNLFYFSCAQASIPSATMIYFLNPLWAALLANLFLDEPLNCERIAVLLVGSFGVTISLWPEYRQSSSMVSHAGLAAALLGSIFQAGQYVAGRVCARNDMHWLHQIVAYSLAGFSLGPAALLATTYTGYADETFVPPSEWTQKVICVTGAIVASAITSQLWLIKGMAYIPATTTAIIRTLDIPMAFAWASLMLGDVPNYFQLFGGFTLLWASIQLSRRKCCLGE